MIIKKRLKFRCNILQLIISISIVLSLIYLINSPDYVIVTFNDKYQNIKITSDDVYQFNGIAYDFYSFNESKGIGEQWKTFPLDDVFGKTLQSTTGLVLVDRIYVTTAKQLTDRQENLRRMFDRYQIQNYEWRMKWIRDACYNDENRDGVDRKLNLNTKKLSEI